RDWSSDVCSSDLGLGEGDRSCCALVTGNDAEADVPISRGTRIETQSRQGSADRRERYPDARAPVEQGRWGHDERSRKRAEEACLWMYRDSPARRQRAD